MSSSQCSSSCLRQENLAPKETSTATTSDDRTRTCRRTFTLSFPSIEIPQSSLRRSVLFCAASLPSDERVLDTLFESLAMAGGLVKYRHLSRKSSHRRALLRNLVTSLIQHESITTTWPKAKEAQRLAEKLITLGKKNTNASRTSARATLFVCCSHS